MYLILCVHTQYVDVFSPVLNLCIPSSLSLSRCDAIRGFSPPGPSCAAMKLESIPPLLPPRVINNPARGCQDCDCVSVFLPHGHLPFIPFQPTGRGAFVYVCVCGGGNRSGYTIRTFVSSVGILDFAVSHTEPLLCCIPVI